MIDTEEAKTIRVRVHTIKMSDVDDPEIYVAQPIYDWQQTEEGKWIMETSCPPPSYNSHFDQSTYGYTYYITAYLKPKDYTFWSLKYK
jgi:hypothetical protein